MLCTEKAPYVVCSHTILQKKNKPDLSYVKCNSMLHDQIFFSFFVEVFFFWPNVLSELNNCVFLQKSCQEDYKKHHPTNNNICQTEALYVDEPRITHSNDRCLSAACFQRHCMALLGLEIPLSKYSQARFLFYEADLLQTRTLHLFCKQQCFACFFKHSFVKPHTKNDYHYPSGGKILRNF